MDIGNRDLERNGASLALRYIVLATLVILVLAQTCFAYTEGDPEYRAFCVDAWHAGALNQTQVNALLGVVGDGDSLGQIREANCNTVIVQVRRNADAMYPSDLNEPYMSGLTPSDFNGLQAVINAAHDTTGGKQRIDVHAWIVVFRTNGGTVYSKHHDVPTGSLTDLDNYWICRDDTGAEVSDKAFDPGHPKAQEYATNVALDLVHNYDIDGINLDYIRFTAKNHGYNPTSIARYNTRYGVTGQPTATDEQFKQWRRDQITAYVRQLYAKIQTVKPWVMLSGSFFTGNPSPTSSTRAGFEGTRPFYEVYSDWDSWMQEGIMDIAVPMTYYDYSSLPVDYTKWMNYEKDRHGNRHMIIGAGLYLNSLADSVLELQKARDQSPSDNFAQGFSGYSYYLPYAGGTWSGFMPSFVAGLTSGGPAAIPIMPWKSSPTKGHISGTVTYQSDGSWADGALVSIVGPQSRTQYCDGTGFYAFIDLTPGTYTITVSRYGYQDAIRSVMLAIGSVTGNMYVNDFQLSIAVPPPTITDVTTASSTAKSANITWTTDQAATSQVEYGTTVSYGNTTTLDSDNVTSHSVNLIDLSPLTTYHYKVASTNSNGSAFSSDNTFVTPALLAITEVQTTDISGTAATITWTTSQAGSSKAEYGTTSGYGLSTTTDSTAVLSHSITLIDLSPNMSYHYRVVSGNDNGDGYSDDNTFTTLGPPVISNIQENNIANTSATITWMTDTASNSQVEYGLTTDYGSTTTLDPCMATEHSVALTGLTANTIYNYRVKSTSAVGTTTSANYTFSTNGPPFISNIQATHVTHVAATITWATNGHANSTVNYGLTAAYGSQNANAEPVTNHSTTITGLTPGTDYHYQCVSTNANGTGASADCTFTTSNIIPDIIVDNTDEGWQNTSRNSNAWTAGCLSSIDKIGESYLCYKGDGSRTESNVTRKCTWTPTIDVEGLYDVYAFYQTGTDRNKTAPYKVYYYNSSLSSVQNQCRNTALTGWYLLGTNLPFSAGTSGYVELTTLSTDSSHLISADATKWVYKGPADLIPPEVSISAPSASVTRRGPVTYVVHFDGASSVSLTSRNILLNKTGTAKASVSVSGTDASTRTIKLSSIAGTGTIGISLAAGTARDAAGNTTAATGPSATFTVDNQAPTVSIGAPSVSATTSGPVDYTVTYTGADTVTLSSANVKLNKNGKVSGTVSVTGTGTQTRTVRISGITGNGTLSISITAGTATDIAGNMAGTPKASATLTVDNSPPTISISKPSVTATTMGPIKYTVTYGGASSITLSANDIILNGTGDANGIVSISVISATARTVTISSLTGSGTLRISIAAGSATDAAGNSAPAVGPSLAFNADNSPPVVSSLYVPNYTTSASSIKASWSASDPESGIKKYEYAIGTSPLGTQVKNWTSAGTSRSKTISGLSLNVGYTYFVSIRAVNGMNLISEPLSSTAVQLARAVSSFKQLK